MTDAQATVRPLLRVRQVREFLTDAPLTAGQLDAIADAARWSGSSQNSQPWRFITVEDRDALRAIAEAGLPQTRSLQSAAAAIAIAMPVIEGRAVSLAYDEGRAAERILVAATLLDLGAGIAWLAGDARTAAARRLGVPEGWTVRTVVALGHPTASARRRRAPAGEGRRPREASVHPERWRD